MALVVKKFGGTSLATPELFKLAAHKIVAARNTGDKMIVVLSAMGHETDRLKALANAITPSPSPRELDVLLSAGERISMSLMSITLEELGCPAKSYTGSQVPIITDSKHNNAQIIEIGINRLGKDLAEGKVPVVAGFCGVDKKGNITTLGRGGSDLTAVALATAFNADECQIHTDVEGVFTTDPRVVPEARLLPHVTFEEMLEMASLGSRVLQMRAMKFAAKHAQPVRVLSSFVDGRGTLITYEEQSMEAAEISGIAFSEDEAQIVITDAQAGTDVASRLLGPVAQAGIAVDMLVQNPAREGRMDMSFSVHRSDFKQALERVRAAAETLTSGSVSGTESVAKISLVGIGIRSHTGVATKMFEALSNQDIQVHMVAASEIRISVLVDERRLEDGVRTLHEAFRLDAERELPPLPMVED